MDAKMEAGVDHAANLRGLVTIEKDADKHGVILDFIRVCSRPFAVP